MSKQDNIVSAYLETVTRAYLEAVAFTETGSDSEIPADAELSQSAKDKARADCAHFLARVEGAGLIVRYLDTQALDQLGHDFWLTRNGHSAGFWDRGLGVLGDQLAIVAVSFNECYAIQGDDGLVYLEGGE